MRVRRSAGLTDPGRKRRRNEDAFVCEPPLFAVADGMGGAQAGEIASRLAAAALREERGGRRAAARSGSPTLIQEANRRVYAALQRGRVGVRDGHDDDGRARRRRTRSRSATSATRAPTSSATGGSSR